MFLTPNCRHSPVVKLKLKLSSGGKPSGDLALVLISSMYVVLAAKGIIGLSSNTKFASSQVV